LSKRVTILREPLVHFLLLGAAIYLVTGWASPAVEEDSDQTIRVTSAEIGWLTTSWEKRWNRPPTARERAGLIDEYVRETVLYREALAMGLDRDDTIIRRRLAQKLEFLSQDLVAFEEPGDVLLGAWYAENRGRYREPPMLTVTHVFFDPDARGDRTLDDARAAVEQLAGRAPDAAELDALGDPFLLQRYYPERTQPELAKLFGSEFAQQLTQLPVGEWHGPVLSGYGTHVVFVHEREEARIAPFAVVRDRVRQDWEDAERAKLNEEFYARLRARYEVIVEDDDPGDGAAMVESVEVGSR
jgi:hypothetical protein